REPHAGRVDVHLPRHKRDDAKLAVLEQGRPLRAEQEITDRDGAEELERLLEEDNDDADGRGHRQHRAPSKQDFNYPLRPVAAPRAAKRPGNLRGTWI